MFDTIAIFIGADASFCEPDECFYRLEDTFFAELSWIKSLHGILFMENGISFRICPRTSVKPSSTVLGFRKGARQALSLYRFTI